MKTHHLILVGLGVLLLADTASAAEVANPTTRVTFTRDVAPILFQNCAKCHRPGEVAPFPLLTYEDARKHARQIKTLTQERDMPPWKAEGGHEMFLDARVLSDDQIALITRWVDAGSPEGNPDDLPPAPKFTEGWALGKPDLVLEMPESYTVPAEGSDVFRCFVLPVDIPEHKFVRAVEYRPGNRKVVHHAILYLDFNGAARILDEKDPGQGYTKFGGPGFPPSGGLGAWAPGASPRQISEDVTKLLRKGSDLVLQVHFHSTGKEEQERSSVALYYAAQPPTRYMTAISLGSKAIDIPAGEKHYSIKDSFVVPINVEATGIIPHAHYLAKVMKAEATFPDGSTKSLLHIKDWDFNWQDQYRYARPVRLPAGTRIDSEFTYDNSADNPRNPSNPPRRVTFGEQTTDEMSMLWIQIIPDRLADMPELWQAFRDRRGRSGGAILAAVFGGGQQPDEQKIVLERFDTNGNGQLDPEEREELSKKFPALNR